MITLDAILGVKHMGGWEWSSDGKYIAYIWDDGGVKDLWVVPTSGGEARQVTCARKGVAAFNWSPKGAGLAVSVDGGLAMAEEPDFTLRPVLESLDVSSGLSWSADGCLLSYIAGSHLYIFAPETGLQCKTQAPGKITGGIRWNQTGEMLLFSYAGEDRVPNIGLCDSKGTLLWASTYENGVGEGQWIDSNTFVFPVQEDKGQALDFFVATCPPERVSYSQIGVQHKLIPDIKHVLREMAHEGKGMVYYDFCGVRPRPNTGDLLFSLERDGWLHHYLYSLSREALEQLTFDPCEDFGHAGDRPAWAPDGKKFAYASNRHQRWSRAIWVYDVEKRTEEKVIDLPVTNVQPKWSPDGTQLAFLHCDQARSADLWVSNIDGTAPRQLTHSMPKGLAEQMQPPEPVTYKGALDWDIDGFLFKPKDLTNKQYPAIVWVHGGPIRQMRGSWHPSRSYAHYYGFHQYLAEQGYVVIEINFRGGIGYGASFRNGLQHKMGVDDVTDVVNAGRFLKSLPYVDADKVAVYGLSYGGYMTLHCLTQYPDEFAMGVNFAGIWDFAQWSRWIEKKFGRRRNLFSAYFGGTPDESPQLYAQGSPVTFKSGLRKPLINFHGIKDANVDFEQMDRIVVDCVEMGAPYETYYYPHEVHFFEKRSTWQDVFPKLLREFERYLK